MKNNIIKYIIIGLGLLAAGIFLKNLFKDKPKQNVMTYLIILFFI